MTIRTTVFNELRSPGTPLLAALMFAADEPADVGPGVDDEEAGEPAGEAELSLVLGELVLADELAEFMAFIWN